MTEDKVIYEAEQVVDDIEAEAVEAEEVAAIAPDAPAQEVVDRYTPRKLPTVVWVLQRMRKPIPKALLKTRTQYNTTLTYIEWHTAVQLTHQRLGGLWSAEVRSVQWGGPKANRVTVTMRVTVQTCEGPFWQEDIGVSTTDADTVDPNTGVIIPAGWRWDQQKNKYIQRGEGFDAEIQAKQQALKRALAQFGLGFGLYLGEGNNG